MAILNDYGEETKEKIHLLVTTLCDRNCKHCCNKQYDLNEIPYVTGEELSQAKKVYITGGEPFKYSNPVEIAGWIKSKFKDIEVYVYTNADELAEYLSGDGYLAFIDGLTVSIKTQNDLDAFENELVHNPLICRLKSNMLYCFYGLYPFEAGNFKVRKRVWQEDFVPEAHSIFRKV